MQTRAVLLGLVCCIGLMPVLADAQGIGRGAAEGSAVGHRAAGPVGGAVGAVVGGVTGGVVGGVKGILGVPQRTDYATRRAGRRFRRHHRS